MKLRSIQLLRAIAIILVVYAHSIDLQMIFGHSLRTAEKGMADRLADNGNGRAGNRI